MLVVADDSAGDPVRRETRRWKDPLPQPVARAEPVRHRSGLADTALLMARALGRLDVKPPRGSEMPSS